MTPLPPPRLAGSAMAARKKVKRMSKLSIRWRLTVWNTAAVAGLLVLCGALVYGLLRRAMYEQTDRLLQSQFQQLRDDRRLATDCRARTMHWVREFKDHVNVAAVVYDASGSVFARTEQLADQSVPPPPGAGNQRSRFATTRVPIIGLQRTLTAPLPAGRQRFTVLMMAPLSEVQQHLGRVRAVLITALPLALLLAAGVGYWLSRKALAPIERLRARADQISADRLDKRLPIDHPNDELGRLAQTINDMIARLERSFAEVRRFTADASHELRTPLAVLRTEVEVAMGRPLDAEQQQLLLASILEECQRLASLTDQLLTLSREEAGAAPYRREPIDLASLVSGVVETMRPLAEAKRQTLVLQADSGARTAGDPARLRQVFYNLLDNAIKYTPPNGRIQVEVSQARQSVTATVRDSGIGIPAADLPHVFDRFYRVDKARSRDGGGAGLGLSIAQTIVHAHDGRLVLASQPDQGTTCQVTLPKSGG